MSRDKETRGRGELKRGRRENKVSELVTVTADPHLRELVSVIGEPEKWVIHEKSRYE